MFLKRTLLAGTVVLATAVAANAADIPMMPEPMTPEPMMPAPSFSWGGAYVGAYGGYLLGPGAAQAGAQAGYNFVSGGFLAGIEVQAGALFIGPAFEGNVNVRAGALLGDSVLLYAEAGLGTIGLVSYTYTFGGGAEFAVGTATSLFIEAKGFGILSGSCCAITVQGGLNFHL